MAFTVEAIEQPRAPLGAQNPLEQNQFDLPVKEFIGYDPKGTTTVTGTQREIPESKEDSTQQNKVEEPAAPEESVSLSPKISALARKEAAQRQRELAFKQREKELEAKLANADKYEQIKAKLAAKDFSAAEELGMTYDEYTTYLLNKQAGEKPEEQRYRKVEEELQTIKKAQEEQVHRDYQANQTLWKEEISKTVKGREEYPEINFRGKVAEEAILQLINDAFDEDNVELSADDAAKLVEKHLVEKSLMYAESPTVKSRLQSSKVMGPPKPGSKTITQNMTVTSQKPAVKPFHLMSESEQLAEAFRRVQAAKQQGR